MNNHQLIKYAHIWALAVLLACGLVAIAVKGGIATRDQNSNQNSNSNTGSQNRNANRSANRNSGNTGAKGEQTGMATMTSQDRNFLMDAAEGGMLEVELGRVAAQKANKPAWRR